MSDRVISLSIELEEHKNATIISVYAPTMTHGEEDTLLFYSKVRKALFGTGKVDKFF